MGGCGGVGGRTPRAGRRWGGTHPCGVGGSDGFMGFMEFIGRCGGRCGTASPSPGLRGGVGGGGQEVGAGRAAGRHPLPPPPPPTVRGGAELPWAHPAPPAAPGAGTWRPARHGTAGTRLPRCQPGGGPGATPTLRDRGGERHPPPFPFPQCHPYGGRPHGGWHPPASPPRVTPGDAAAPPPPNPPIPPIGDSGAGEPAGTSPAPRGCPPPPRVFPTLRAQRDAFGSPPAPRGGGGTRAAALSAVPGGGGERTPPHPSPQSDAPGGALSPANAAPGSGGRGAIFSRSAAPRPLRAFLPPPLRPPSPPTKMRPRAPPGPGPALTVPSGPRWPWRRRARAAARKLRGIFSPRATPAP